MNTNTEREELAKLISSRHTMAAVDAMLAAGYSKPRTITTVEELDALPFYSVITDAYDTPYVCEKHRLDGTGNEWSAAGSSHLQDSWSVLEHGDVTVRYTPEPTR